MSISQYSDGKEALFDFRSRVSWTVIGLLLLLFILVTRLMYLQIFKMEYFQVRAESNRIKITPSVPNRGLIYDRHGNILAKNYSSYSLDLDYVENYDPRSTLDSLREFIDISDKTYKEAVGRINGGQGLSTVTLKDDLSDEELAAFTVNSYRFPNLRLSARLYREYPYGELTSHLVGHVGRLNPSNLSTLEQKGERANYVATDRIGKRGVEAYYESFLRGELGFHYVEVDSRGREVRVIDQIPPVAGGDLHLSLDVELQKIAFEAFGNYRGALVAIDPSDGSVLAFVSKPGYDPGMFVNGVTHDVWSKVISSPDRPLVNRVTSGVYPPGSTIKPFFALAGLDGKYRTKEWSMFDPGYFQLSKGGHRFRDWKKGGHGIVDVTDAIAKSCDTYFYQLASEMGIDELHESLVKFGFGSKTGIDLPGESSGLAPSRQWKKKRFGVVWYPGDTISVGIGQGYNLVTPIQLAVATAALANGQNLLQPRVLMPSLTAELDSGNISEQKKLEFSAKNLNTVQAAMAQVMSPGGTAAAVGEGADFAIAGKTGTAQVFGLEGEEYDEGTVEERLRDHALFIAYAPTTDPELAIAVIVENGGNGGSVAAPIARRVFDAHMVKKSNRQK